MSSSPSAQHAVWLPPAIAVALVIALALLVNSQVTDAFDHAVIGFVRDPGRDGLLAPLGWITQLGSTLAVVAVAAAIVGIGWTAGRPRTAMIGGLTIGIGSLIISVLKRVMQRARPDLLDPVIVETGFSFPSGHAANAMVAYGIAAVVIGRLPAPRWARVSAQAVLAVLVFLIGLSRVWLGVHYPTDVIAGWLIGSVAVLAYAELSRPGQPGRGAEVAGVGRGAPRSDPPAAA